MWKWILITKLTDNYLETERLRLLRSDVLAASMKQSRTSVRDWVKTLFTLTAVNILFTSSVTLLIKMYS